MQTLPGAIVRASDLEESAVTLIKIIIITLAVILSILLFGRFLF
jgi:hypothetical protein